MFDSGKRALSVLTIGLTLFLLDSAVPQSARWSARSDKIDAALADLLAQAEPDQSFQVEIRLSDTLTGAKLARYLDSAYVRLEDKRRAGLRILHERADAAQRDLLNQLAHLEHAGLVAHVESNWLTNSISAAITGEALDSLAGRDEIEYVSQPPTMVQIKPEDSDRRLMPPAASGVEDNLSVIGADSAWRMGYTGEDRIICVFDGTGVDGHHPALADNWKGLDGDSSAAWKESGGQAFPHPRNYVGDSTHGTMMVGITIGHDDIAGDTVGVAPGAKWISAMGIDFQWAADPDGNPNTTADIPDAINFSMGFAFGRCWDIYWDEIDMVEALGAVVVFAAGNGGYGPYTIISPADRADDSLTNFAVGSIDYVSGNVWWSSSRGPSLCDSVSIKPNVVAPGSNIRCAVPGGGYEYHGGTSMATPHVTGAVAILRQYAPDATARQIKEALLAGATPRGDVHPNNNYGWGIINIPKSMEYLSQTFAPDLRVSGFDYTPTEIGDTLSATLSVLNRGYAADSVYLICRGRFPGMTVLTDSIYFGAVDHLAEVPGDRPFRFVFDDTLVCGPTIPMWYTVYAGGGYAGEWNGAVITGVAGPQTSRAHENDRFKLTVSNYGYLSLYQNLGAWLDPYVGLIDAELYMAGSLLIAQDSTRVSDRIVDRDFWVDARDPMAVSEPGETADFQTDCIFNDGMADLQIGVEVRQQSYSWSEAGDNNFVVLEYQLTNPTSRDIREMYVGLALGFMRGNFCYYFGPDCIDPDSMPFRSDCVESDRLGYFEFNPCGLDTNRYYGLTLLSRSDSWSYRSSRQTNPSEAEKYAALTGGVVREDTAINRFGGVQYVSGGPFDLDPGESDTIAFAVIVGNSLDELRATALRAHNKWKQISPTQNLPETFLLRQNYPNPFNAGTNIDFDLSAGGRTRLTVYNVLGQTVRTLIDGPLPAGEHRVVWDGSNVSGRTVASGVYFYRLETGPVSESKKMLLLK